MKKEEYKKWLIKKMKEWIEVPDNYSFIHFAIEHNLSKKELIRICSEDKELQKMLDYVMSVQEYKITDGALSGNIDKNVALKMLETYSGWKDSGSSHRQPIFQMFTIDDMSLLGIGNVDKIKAIDVEPCSL